MAYFGVKHTWDGNVITIMPQTYTPRPFTVEADWSAASYYYSIAALADEADLELHGLFEESTQGDAAIAEMMTDLGVTTTYHDGYVRIQKTHQPKANFEYDFIK